MSPNVTVDPAPATERGLIEGLYQFYIYDFAAMYGPEEAFDVEPDGRFGVYTHIESYWSDPDRRPFVIRFEGRPAGFVLLNRISHRGGDIDHAVAEFFVMRPFRRLGVGKIAAHAVFARFPGRWELAIAAVNAGGRKFWPKVVAEAPNVSDLQTIDLDEAGRFRRLLVFTIEPGG